MTNRQYSEHYEDKVLVPIPQTKVFEYLDDHRQFSSHMNQPSGMMGGSSMKTIIDKDNFQKVGSHLEMSGQIWGIKLFLDEVVTQREPPKIKTWETVGTPKLLVVGHYKMTLETYSLDKGTEVSVSIDYNLPETNQWLGKFFGKTYAKWCVRLMIDGVKKEFVS